MTMPELRSLGDELAFGCRVGEIAFEDLEDHTLRERLRRQLRERGLILFERVEPTDRMQIAIGTVFGPLKDYGTGNGAPQSSQVTEIVSNPETATLVEIDGRPQLGWMPWHFDQCYNATLNGARVLRAGQIPPAGGQTCFLDGIDLYRSIAEGLRQRFEGKSIIYTIDMNFDQLHFGRPGQFRVLRFETERRLSIERAAQSRQRAIHPATWMHPSGFEVLHVSPWMAAAIEGEDTARGAALLEELSHEINRLGDSTIAYCHSWREGEMLVWDNCRMLHAVTGCDRMHRRSMYRSTIGGDYGLGRWERATTRASES